MADDPKDPSKSKNPLKPGGFVRRLAAGAAAESLRDTGAIGDHITGKVHGKTGVAPQVRTQPAQKATLGAPDAAPVADTPTADVKPSFVSAIKSSLSAGFGKKASSEIKTPNPNDGLESQVVQLAKATKAGLDDLDQEMDEIRREVDRISSMAASAIKTAQRMKLDQTQEAFRRKLQSSKQKRELRGRFVSEEFAKNNPDKVKRDPETGLWQMIKDWALPAAEIGAGGLAAAGSAAMLGLGATAAVGVAGYSAYKIAKGIMPDDRARAINKKHKSLEKLDSWTYDHTFGLLGVKPKDDDEPEKKPDLPEKNKDEKDADDLISFSGSDVTIESKHNLTISAVEELTLKSRVMTIDADRIVIKGEVEGDFLKKLGKEGGGKKLGPSSAANPIINDPRRSMAQTKYDEDLAKYGKDKADALQAAGDRPWSVGGVATRARNFLSGKGWTGDAENTTKSRQSGGYSGGGGDNSIPKAVKGGDGSGYKSDTERLYHQQGNLKGLDPKLLHLMRESSRDLPDGYHAEIISGHDARSTGTTNHPNGIASDIQIFDNKGNLVPYDRGGPGMKYYEQFHQSMVERGKVLYPDEKWIWGGTWQSRAAGNGDPMHMQRLDPSVPGSSRSSGAYNDDKGAHGHPFEKYLMSDDERSAYKSSIAAKAGTEYTRNPDGTVAIRGGSQGQPSQSTAQNALAEERAAVFDHLDKNPALKEKLFAVATNEQSLHPEGVQGVMEETINRAIIRGGGVQGGIDRLNKEIRFTSEGGYYEDRNGSADKARARAADPKNAEFFNSAYEKVRAGSNISNNAYGNASGGTAQNKITGAGGIRATPTNTINGETFFGPNSDEPGYLKNYQERNQRLAAREKELNGRAEPVQAGFGMPSSVADKGTPAVPAGYKVGKGQLADHIGPDGKISSMATTFGRQKIIDGLGANFAKLPKDVQDHLKNASQIDLNKIVPHQDLIPPEMKKGFAENGLTFTPGKAAVPPKEAPKAVDKPEATPQKSDGASFADRFDAVNDNKKSDGVSFADRFDAVNDKTSETASPKMVDKPSDDETPAPPSTGPKRVIVDQPAEVVGGPESEQTAEAGPSTSRQPTSGQDISAPTNNPESEAPRPGSDGYGDKAENPDCGLCSVA